MPHVLSRQGLHSDGSEAGGRHDQLRPLSQHSPVLGVGTSPRPSTRAPLLVDCKWQEAWYCPGQPTDCRTAVLVGKFFFLVS